MPNTKNQENTNTLKEAFSNSTSVTFVEYKGLKANVMNEFRQKMKESSSEVRVAKNTLLRIAMESFPQLKDIKGQSAAVFSKGDAISAIKTVLDFAKKNTAIEIKGSILENKFFGKNETLSLSTIPSKEELLAKFMYGVKSPVTGFATMLSGTQKKFMYALIELQKKKEVQ